jgi:ATP-binding cassette subfamily F protein 3
MREPAVERRAPGAPRGKGAEERSGRGAEGKSSPQPPAPSPPPAEPKARTREAKRAEAEARQRKSREIAPLRARLKEAETEIAALEARIRRLTDEMANPDLYKDGDRAREVARERKGLEEQVGSLYGKWEELAGRLEAAMAERG